MPDYANAEKPERIPVHSPSPSYPVIARLVLPDRSEEWRPSRAIRWTATHVLVGWDEGTPDDKQTQYLWLRADDVARVIYMPAPPEQAVGVTAP